ncbi:hypothetical protein D3C77_606960 [compost metagenome]
MAGDKQTPKLALVKGGAEPVLEALAQRAAQHSGESTTQRPDSTYQLANRATPDGTLAGNYRALHEASEEAEAMLSLLATSLRMIAGGYGSDREARKLASSSVKAAEAAHDYLHAVLQNIELIDRRDY